MPWHCEVTLGPRARFLGAACHDARAGSFASDDVDEPGERFRLVRTRRCRQLDLHGLEFAADRDEQVDFQPGVRPPEMQVRPAAQCHECLDRLDDHPAFEQRTTDRTGECSTGVGLASELPCRRSAPRLPAVSLLAKSDSSGSSKRM